MPRLYEDYKDNSNISLIVRFQTGRFLFPSTAINLISCMMLLSVNGDILIKCTSGCSG